MILLQRLRLFFDDIQSHEIRKLPRVAFYLIDKTNERIPLLYSLAFSAIGAGSD